jgi:hypothetical protein
MDHPVAEYRQGWVASNQVWLAGHLLSNSHENEFELPEGSYLLRWQGLPKPLQV